MAGEDGSLLSLISGPTFTSFDVRKLGSRKEKLVGEGVLDGKVDRPLNEIEAGDGASSK